MSKQEKLTNHIVIFNDHKIRRVFHEGAWWFVVIDIIAVLTDSMDPSGYIRDVRRRDPELSKIWSNIVLPRLVESAGGLKKLIVQIQKECFVLFSQSHLQKLNHLNDG